MSARGARLGGAVLLLYVVTSACARTDSRPAAPAGSAASTAQRPGAANARGEVSVEVIGVQDARGQLLVALHRDPRGFPGDVARAYGRRAVKARVGTVRTVFENVPAGELAVAVVHDRDGDFELDTGLFGIPSEPYGFSRDARAAFGPPDFAAAKVVLAAGERKRLKIRLRR